MRARTLYRPYNPTSVQPPAVAEAADDASDVVEAGAAKRQLPGKRAPGRDARAKHAPASRQPPGKGVVSAALAASQRGGRGGRRLRPGKGRMAVPSKRTFTVLRLLERRKAALGGAEYLVEWAGFPLDSASWEPESHISPFLVEAFEKSTVDPQVSESIKARELEPEREVSAAERDILLDSSCPVYEREDRIDKHIIARAIVAPECGPDSPHMGPKPLHDFYDNLCVLAVAQPKAVAEQHTIRARLGIERCALHSKLSNQRSRPRARRAASSRAPGASSCSTAPACRSWTSRSYLAPRACPRSCSRC